MTAGHQKAEPIEKAVEQFGMRQVVDSQENCGVESIERLEATHQFSSQKAAASAHLGRLRAFARFPGCLVDAGVKAGLDR